MTNTTRNALLAGAMGLIAIALGIDAHSTVGTIGAAIGLIAVAVAVKTLLDARGNAGR